MINQQEIINLFSSLKNKKGLQVFLHGSYGDNSTTAFSDIDDFVIIDDVLLTVNEIEDIEMELNKIENQFYKIDPLQHHGHWKIKKSELNNYNNSYIPIFILDEAISLIGSSKIKVSIDYNKTIKGLYQNIKITCQNIEFFYQKYKENKLNIHYLKCFVGSVVLLPPLLFQLKGYNYTKKTAIQKADEIFSPFSMKLIKWATDLRSNWFKITKSNEYLNFVEQQEKIGLGNWKSFSEENSPILNYELLSSFKLSDDLIDSFINGCINCTETCSLKKYGNNEYDLLYSEIEIYAINIGATLVGKFGEVKNPGISDLDIFICFPDNIYKESLDKLNKFIYSKRENLYLIVHPTVCIPVSILPHLKYLHTINNIKLTFNVNNIKLDINLDPEYSEMINILWTFFLIPIAESYVSDIKYKTTRDLLLVLKNIHTSLDNLLEINGQKPKFLKKSKELRDKVFIEANFNRKIIKNVFKDDFNELLKILNSMGGNSSKYLVVSKNFILKSGNYHIVKKGSKLYFTIPFYFFSIFKTAFFNTKNNKYIKQYIESYTFNSNYIKKNKTENQFIQLIPFIKYKNKSIVKRTIFYTVSFLPYKTVKNLIS